MSGEIPMSVLEEIQDDVYRITFNRPEQKNAFNFELLSDLYRSICNAEANKSSIVVIRGSGKAFSAGGDIADFRNMKDPDSMSEGMELLNKSILMIRSLNAIVIAVLEGPVVGAAVGLSLACDLSVAVENAVINLAFRKIGLAPDGGGSILLPRIIGAKRFNELFLFARNIDMAEAEALGLVNFVWQEEGFEEKLQQMIDDLKALPMESIKHFKNLTNNAVFSGLEAQLLQEQITNCHLFTKPSFKERLELLFKSK
jgi:2-(1,2-epoxy-1,2-dihydrophenyl)acetyl-CoA isomerase